MSLWASCSLIVQAACLVDRIEMQAGAAWQQHIFNSLCQARKVICMFSPEYLASKVCQDEYNTAWLRHRKSEGGILLPVISIARSCRLTWRSSITKMPGRATQ